MLRLARGAMAQLAIQWLFSAQLVLDLPAVAVGLVFRVEVLVFRMDLIRGTRLPLVDSGRRLSPSLVFVHYRNLYSRSCEVGS